MSAFERLGKLSGLHRSMLIEALQKDLNDVVRHEAAFLLAHTFSHIPDSEIPLIRAATGDASILVRHEACLALAKFKTRTAFDALLQCVSDPSPEVRSSAKYALEEFTFAKPEGTP